MQDRKPQHRSEYDTNGLEIIKSACLTLAITLGAYLDDLCIVGGLVPALLIDSKRDAPPDEVHPGTNDLDVGLALAVLDDSKYAEISARLRAEGFEPDTNDAGNLTVQRWRMRALNVTVDFLIPPARDQDSGRRIHNLENDFGALLIRGLELAFDERVNIDLSGTTLMAP
jgi:hypothetical protein